jgi:hypothetical protein
MKANVLRPARAVGDTLERQDGFDALVANASSMKNIRIVGTARLTTEGDVHRPEERAHH